MIFADLFAAIRELSRQYPLLLFNAQFAMWVISFSIGSATEIHGGSVLRAAEINLLFQLVLVAIVFARYVTKFRQLRAEVAISSVRSLLAISIFWGLASFAIISALSAVAARSPLVFDLLIALELVAAWLAAYGVYWLAAKSNSRVERF